MAVSKSILIVRPASLDDTMRAAMAEAGVLVVEAADPADVRLLTAEPAPLSGDDMLYAALASIADSGIDSIAMRYVRHMRELMKTRRAEERAAKAPAIKQPIRGPGGRFVKSDAS